MISITYEARELDPQTDQWLEKTRHFTTEMEEVKQIVPQDNKVGIHLSGTTLMIPFNRIYQLEIELDEETVNQLEGGQEQ